MAARPDGNSPDGPAATPRTTARLAPSHGTVTRRGGIPHQPQTNRRITHALALEEIAITKTRPTLFQNLADAVLGVTTVTVLENERLVALRDGRLLGILAPGRHRLAARSNRLTFERHALNAPEIETTYEAALAAARPDGVCVETAGAGELVILFRDGAFNGVVRPGERKLVWEDAGVWETVRVNLDTEVEAPRALAERLKSNLLTLSSVTREIAVPDGHVGVLSVDGVRERMLQPGRHWFWVVTRRIEAKLIDLRLRTLEIAGQELLTQDRVTIRVNLAVEHRVTDPVKAVSVDEDFEAALYRAAQLAFRRLLGGLSLDAILERKAALDTEVLPGLAARMAPLGVEVTAVALKDVVLPGEMRAILNGVVAAEKEAEANVIRRREETAATRALLNTAKVMAENPVMLRLKELEALETISARVGQLVVHNGPKGLLSDIARLGD